jgi:hypothetical protein
MSCCKYNSWDHVHNISFSFKLTNGPNKLECLSLVSLSSCVIEQSSFIGYIRCYRNDLHFIADPTVSDGPTVSPAADFFWCQYYKPFFLFH